MTAPEPAGEAEALAVDGLRWLTAAARETADRALAWAPRPSDDIPAPTLYSVTAGIIGTTPAYAGTTGASPRC